MRKPRGAWKRGRESGGDWAEMWENALWMLWGGGLTRADEDSGVVAMEAVTATAAATVATAGIRRGRECGMVTG